MRGKPTVTSKLDDIRSVVSASCAPDLLVASASSGLFDSLSFAFGLVSTTGLSQYSCSDVLDTNFLPSAASWVRGNHPHPSPHGD